MTGLQEAFYIISIIFMSLIFLLIVALVAAVFIIKSKINNIHDSIEDKVSALAGFVGAGSAVARQAKKVVKKSKK
jgi:hypothetical protein